MKLLLVKLFIIISIVNYSCDDYLNLEPISVISSNAFWKSEDDAVGALSGMYAQFRDDIASYDLYLIGEGRSDVMGNSLAAAVLVDFDQNTLTPDNLENRYGGISINWQDIYKVINSCNQILNYVPEISFANPEKKNNIIAQSFAMRAYLYFICLKTWGGVPIVTEVVSDNLTNLQRKRNTANEVLELIKDDIDKSISLFPDILYPENRALWSFGSVNALKASVYLWSGKVMGGDKADFEIALEACNKVQSTDTRLLPEFSSVFEFDNKGNEEILFAVRRTFDEYKGGNIQSLMYPLEMFFPGPLDPVTSSLLEPYAGAPYWEPSPKVRNLYDQDDKRKNASFLEVYYKNDSGVREFITSVIIKFNGTVIGGSRYFIDDYIIFRYADVLLMKAEALNALDMDPSKEINEIRKRAYGDNSSNYTFTSSNKLDNDRAILNERFKELLFEGKRWWDLIRFNMAFELVPSLQDRKGQDYLLLFPIPKSTLSLNPDLEQNPGY